MKRLRIVIFGILFVILSYAFSLASEIDCEIIHCVIIEQEPVEAVKIAWDAVTIARDAVTKFINSKNISSKHSEGYVIGYLLYINQNKDGIEDHRKKVPVFGLEARIAPGIWNGSGLYYVGVRTAIYKNENLSEPVEVSEEICWSDNRDCTNNNPFVLKVEN